MMRLITLPNTNDVASVAVECPTNYSYRHVAMQIKLLEWAILLAKGSRAASSMAKRVAIHESAEDATEESIAVLCRSIVLIMQRERSKASFLSRYLRWGNRHRLECSAYYTQGFALGVLGVSTRRALRVMEALNVDGYSVWRKRCLAARLEFVAHINEGFQDGYRHMRGATS
jgi:hypothetical protein